MLTDGNHTYHDEHLVMYIIVESLRCTSESNIILHINCISIKKLKKFLKNGDF